MARKGRRFAIVIWFLVLTGVAVLCVRSIWRRDALVFTSMVEQRDTAVIDTYCLEIEHLGIGILYDQQMLTMRRDDPPHRLDAVPVGLRIFSEKASNVPLSLARRLGFGYERVLDARLDHFTNTLRISVPIWLVVLFLWLWKITLRRGERGRVKNVRPSSATVRS